MQETVMEVVCAHRWAKEIPGEGEGPQRCLICGIVSTSALKERVVIGRVEEVVKEAV